MSMVSSNARHVRLVCSIQAMTICWGIAGIVFNLVVKGPGTLTAWLIWGSGVCFIWWALVGIPVVAAGNRILRLRPAVLAIAVGLCGVLVMELPHLTAVLKHNFGAGSHMVVAPDKTLLELEGSAFLIAATAALLYRGLLIKSQATT